LKENKSTGALRAACGGALQSWVVNPKARLAPRSAAWAALLYWPVCDPKGWRLALRAACGGALSAVCNPYTGGTPVPPRASGASPPRRSRGRRWPCGRGGWVPRRLLRA